MMNAAGQTTQEAVMDSLTSAGADTRVCFTAPAEKSFAEFKIQVDAFVEGSNSAVEDRDDHMEMLSDADMDELCQDVLAWEADRLAWEQRCYG